jgi:chromosome segregation ATPase
MTEIRLPPVSRTQGRPQVDYHAALASLRHDAEQRALSWLTGVVLASDAQKMLELAEAKIAGCDAEIEELEERLADLEQQREAVEVRREEARTAWQEDIGRAKAEAQQAFAEADREWERLTDQLQVTADRRQWARQERSQYGSLARRLRAIEAPTLDDLPALRDLLEKGLGQE